MRFTYSATGHGKSGVYNMPRIPLVLRIGSKTVEVVGLVDSGSAVNVLPWARRSELAKRSQVREHSGRVMEAKQPSSVAVKDVFHLRIG